MNFQDLTEYLDTLERFVPARELIICQNHEVIFHYKSKFSDVYKTKKLTGNEIYLLYSSTKVSTCVGALRLVERGLLNLEDKVSKYLPEYANLSVMEAGNLRPAKTDLLVKHLFTMCGGFSYNITCEDVKCLKDESTATTREVIRQLAKEPLLFDPGTHFDYSLCHDILGAVIEAVSGKTLDRYLKDEIFLPLSMYDTTFHLNKEQKNRLITHYVYDRESGSLTVGDNLCTDFHLSPIYESGGAGLYSTTSDYAKLADAIACGGQGYNGYQVLKPEMVEMYSKNWLNKVQLEDFWRQHNHLGQGYGLGAMMLMDREPKNWKCAEGIFGWGGAAGTKTVMDTKNRISFYYSQEVIGGPKCSYEEHQHNVIINMIYQILENEKKI